MPLRKQIKLKRITQDVVSKMITDFIKNSVEQLKEFHEWYGHIWSHKIYEIQQKCKQMKEYISRINPIVLENMILPVIYRTFKLLRNFCHKSHLYILDGAKYLNIRHTCLCILGSVLFPCIQELDLRVCEDFTLGLVIENLTMIFNVKKLIISRNVAPLTLILHEKIRFLKALRELHCYECCSNQILCTVARFCKELTLLDVRRSKQVDDFSVHSIIRLPSLETLIITETQISDPGYREILLNLPELKNVSWPSLVEQVIRDVPLERTSKYVCADVKVVAPNLFCTKCPNISELVITSQGEEIDMSVLSQLTQLTDLEIRDFDFIESKIDLLLQQSGPILKILSLCCVYNVDGGIIINNCSNLKTLNLKSCYFTANSLVYTERSHPHFVNLQVLALSSNIDSVHFYACIKFYRNLEVFHIINAYEINDRFVRNLVEGNVFMNLIDFFAAYCSLNYSTAELLIDNCAKLQTIGNLNFWQIDDNNQEYLKTKVRSQNLDIEFIHTQVNPY